MSDLETRLLGFASHPDPDTILGPAAVSEAAAMLGAAKHLLHDHTAVAAAGILHYLRWMADQDDVEELQVATMLSAPLLDGHAGLMPATVRLFLAKERKKAKKKLVKKPEPGDNPAKRALRAFLTAKPSGREAAWAELLWQLSLVLHGRYERTRDIAVLGEAVAVLQHSIQATPSGDPRLPGRQAILSTWLLVRHEETQQAGDLHAALRAVHPALAGWPERVIPGRGKLPAVLSALGSGLDELFVLTGDLDALDEAISAHREALRGVPPDDAGFGRRALSLAGALLRHYERTTLLSSLNEAIEQLKSAQAAAERHAEGDLSVLAALSNNLSIALRARYERVGEQADLDEAIAQSQRALGEAVTAPARRAAHGTLGMALLSRYFRYANAGPYNVTGTSVRDEALEHMRAAAAMCPIDDPRRAVALSNLGTALLRAQAAADTPGLAAEAADAFGTAAESPVAAPSVRIVAGIIAGRLAADLADWAVASRRFAAAVGLLDQAVPRSLRRRDREHQLTRVRDLASDAAASAWRNGDAGAAAVLFEQARGVLLAQAMDVPADLERLGAKTGNLAARFDRLRQDIDDAGSDDPVADASDWTEPTGAERRSDLIGEWNELIGEIRQVPDLEGFLLPPREDGLRAAAAEGPVVFVNVSRYGSAAFLVQADTIAEVALPDLSPAAVRAMAAELLTITDTSETADEMARDEQSTRLEAMLGWLWDVIAGPVLDHLGLTTPLGHGASGPRVWWCPSGLLSFLPLHAAGQHGTRNDPVPQTVMDRVVSSYIPTIRTLRHTRRAPESGQGPTLVVAPDQDGLPGALAEAALLGTLTTAELLAGADATPGAVLSALGAHRRVHFACHARSDLEDPSASFLELHDGQPLAVSDVVAARPAGAQFAFLSACSTYQPGAVLADEAIHLGSAFQMAGYPRVIATLWPVPDTLPTRRITEKVYRGIAGPGGLAAMAAALNQAVRDERDRAPGAPGLWAAHVYSGA
jgi:tetratricopeptide (TPR) repeat protein